MLDENTIDLLSFKAEIGENGTIRIPEEKLGELRAKGVSKVRVNIGADINQILTDIDVDPVLYDDIKKTQSLPDNITLGFLRSKGKLGNTGFGKRIPGINE